MDGRTLEPTKPELGDLMRRETVRKGPEAEEQTRFRIPKLLPGIRLGRGGVCIGRDCAISCSLAGNGRAGAK